MRPRPWLRLLVRLAVCLYRDPAPLNQVHRLRSKLQIPVHGPDRVELPRYSAELVAYGAVIVLAIGFLDL